MTLCGEHHRINSPVLLVAVRVCAWKTACDVMVKWFLSGLRVFSPLGSYLHPCRSAVPGLRTEPNPRIQPSGLRATGLIRHACCHVAPEYSCRFRRRRQQWWRQRGQWWWQWNQTPCRHLHILQRGFGGPCQHGPLDVGEGLQEWLSELRQLRYPHFRSKLHYAAGQWRAEVCWCSSTAEGSFQLQRYIFKGFWHWVWRTLSLNTHCFCCFLQR